MRAFRLAGAAAVAVVLAFAAAAPASAPVPVLGASFIQSKGFGHAHPSQIIYGGTAITFNLNHVRWKHWGARQATATADGWYVPPGKAISGGHVVKERLVAYDLGTCKGKYAYRRMSRYAPSLGQRFHPTSNDRLSCT